MVEALQSTDNTREFTWTTSLILTITPIETLVEICNLKVVLLSHGCLRIHIPHLAFTCVGVPTNHLIQFTKVLPEHIRPAYNVSKLVDSDMDASGDPMQKAYALVTAATGTISFWQSTKAAIATETATEIYESTIEIPINL